MRRGLHGLPGGSLSTGNSHVYRALYDGHRRNLRNVGGGWVTCFPLTGVTSPQEAKIYAVYFDPPAGGGSRAGGGDEDEAAALSVSMTAGDLLAKGDQFATAGATLHGPGGLVRRVGHPGQGQ